MPRAVGEHKAEAPFRTSDRLSRSNGLSGPLLPSTTIGRGAELCVNGAPGTLPAWPRCRSTGTSSYVSDTFASCSSCCSCCGPLLGGFNASGTGAASDGPAGGSTEAPAATAGASAKREPCGAASGIGNAGGGLAGGFAGGFAETPAATAAASAKREPCGATRRGLAIACRSIFTYTGACM